LVIIPQLQLRAAESKTDGETLTQAALCLWRILHCTAG